MKSTLIESTVTYLNGMWLEAWSPAELSVRLMAAATLQDAESRVFCRRDSQEVAPADNV